MAAEQQRDPVPLHNWASIAAGYYHEMPRMRAELLAAVTASRNDVLEQVGRLAAEVARMRQPRSMSPPRGFDARGLSGPPRAFDPELTMSGQKVRIPTEQWNEIVGLIDRVDGLEAEKTEDAEKLAKLLEEKRDAEKVAEALAAKAKKRRERMAYWLPFVVAGAAGGGWLLTHVFHL